MALLVLGLVPLVAVVPMAGARQDPTGEPVVGRDSPTPPPRVVIDGAKNPERIPDDEVIRVLMWTWTLSPDADAAAERRLHGLPRRLGLDEADGEVLRQVLRQASPRLTAAQQRHSEARSLTALRAARADSRILSVEVYNRLLELLSADGGQQLREYVAAAKTRIVVRAVR